ncbi:unnamed protein product [Protopolystoma xenopodis]|uniref:Uncharacterized protein n=1 Tax=Protopolystoma xenopodis TaxID=117903 RepID=A0A3S5BMA2_9PLAT|nr:unnamed protein product [Protopolystoma xenopodis]
MAILRLFNQRQAHCIRLLEDLEAAHGWQFCADRRRLNSGAEQQAASATEEASSASEHFAKSEQVSFSLGLWQASLNNGDRQLQISLMREALQSLARRLNQIQVELGGCRFGRKQVLTQRIQVRPSEMHTHIPPHGELMDRLGSS